MVMTIMRPGTARFPAGLTGATGRACSWFMNRERGREFDSRRVHCTPLYISIMTPSSDLSMLIYAIGTTVVGLVPILTVIVLIRLLTK